MLTYECHGIVMIPAQTASLFDKGGRIQEALVYTFDQRSVSDLAYMLGIHEEPCVDERDETGDYGLISVTDYTGD